MKKVLIGVLVLILVLGVAAWYFTTFRLDGLIKQQIEQVGSNTLNTQVTVGSVTTDLKNGSLIISDVVVANPPGFNNPNAFSLSGIEAALDYDTLDIRRIIIEKPEIVIEELNGETNFSTLLANMDSEPEPEPETDTGPPPELVIHLFRMNESRAAFESKSMDRYTDLKVKAVEVKNVRGTPAEVTEVIVREILDEVISAAAVELLKAKASEKLGTSTPTSR